MTNKIEATVSHIFQFENEAERDEYFNAGLILMGILDSILAVFLIGYYKNEPGAIKLYECLVNVFNDSKPAINIWLALLLGCTLLNIIWHKQSAALTSEAENSDDQRVKDYANSVDQFTIVIEAAFLILAFIWLCAHQGSGFLAAFLLIGGFIFVALPVLLTVLYATLVASYLVEGVCYAGKAFKQMTGARKGYSDYKKQNCQD